MENRPALLLRLPAALKTQIEMCAREHKRSTTREIELAVERHVAALNNGTALQSTGQ
jgi:hypothetical protein